jgi:hypothetical protein
VITKNSVPSPESVEKFSGTALTRAGVIEEKTLFGKQLLRSNSVHVEERSSDELSNPNASIAINRNRNYLGEGPPRQRQETSKCLALLQIPLAALS